MAFYTSPSGYLQETTARPLEYEVEQTHYPDDLFSSNYGGNYVIFYINEQDNSKLRVDNLVKMPPGERFKSGDKVDPKAMATATKSEKTYYIPGGTKERSNTNAAIGRQTKRLKSAIALYLPNQMNNSYNTSWDQFETNKMLAVGGQGATAIEGLIGGKFNPEALQATGENLVVSVGSIMTKVVPQDIKDTIESGIGMAINPKRDQAFKGVDFRTFNFNYMFFPKSESEAVKILNIITTFKYHMHPEYAFAGNATFIYPSEFDIVYYNQGEENPHLHKHTSLVLTRLSVDYTPNGMVSTFENGMPTHIQLGMEFKELGIITKEEILKGY